ncbi:MAG: hypothetical protein GY722_24995 [bacterium]|nr:hypothetical protein [bacterium]
MPGRKAFSFDPNRCTGCQACELACTIENGLDGTSWRQVSTAAAALCGVAAADACNLIEGSPATPHNRPLHITPVPRSGLL